MAFSRAIKQQHLFHLVTPSPWPLLTSFSLLALMLSAVTYFHAINHSLIEIMISVFCLGFCVFRWFTDIISEATFEGNPMLHVHCGMRKGIFYIMRFSYFLKKNFENSFLSLNFFFVIDVSSFFSYFLIFLFFVFGYFFLLYWKNMKVLFKTSRVVYTDIFLKDPAFLKNERFFWKNKLIIAFRLYAMWSWLCMAVFFMQVVIFSTELSFFEAFFFSRSNCISPFLPFEYFFGMAAPISINLENTVFCLYYKYWILSICFMHSLLHMYYKVMRTYLGHKLLKTNSKVFEENVEMQEKMKTIYVQAGIFFIPGWRQVWGNVCTLEKVKNFCRFAAGGTATYFMGSKMHYGVQYRPYGIQMYNKWTSGFYSHNELTFAGASELNRKYGAEFKKLCVDPHTSEVNEKAAIKFAFDNGELQVYNTLTNQGTSESK